MAKKIVELTQDQILDWTLEQKDRWWLKNIYRGDMPQLNARSAITGMLLGGILSLTNLYIGVRTGWTLGVGITSVILSYALFRFFAALKIGREMTVLENNAMQSVATSAGYMTAPLISSIPAFMLITGQVIPMWQTMAWVIVLSILGVLYAFPLKKRFINDEQLPFPEGYAAGVVLQNLHEEHSKEGIYKAKLLGAAAGLSSFFEVWRSEAFMKWIKAPFLKLPDNWDDFLYKFATPKILGTPLRDLTVQWETSLVLFASGGLMNFRTGFSLILGGVINYMILAPIMIQKGIIHGSGFKNISMWALWGGVAMMTTSTLYSFLSKPRAILQSFQGLFQRRGGTKDVLAHIELPIQISLIGIPLVGALTVWMGHRFFHFGIFEGIIAIPLTFVFTLIAVNSTGLTSITPGSALGKLTQLTYSVISPGNAATNIMAAGINSEISLNTSNLLMDIKPGYMLGAKPRQQALGHILGVFAGAAVAVPVYYLIFKGDISRFTSDALPMPTATVWKAVAEALTHGLSVLHPTARWAVLIGGVLGIFFEFLTQKTRGRFPISGMGLGLAPILRFTDCWTMGLGALLFWYLEKRYKDPKTTAHKIWVENRETLCAGGIAGGSIIGIILILIETLA